MSIFKTFTLTVKRYSSAGYVNGKWIKGEPEIFTIKTTWQSVNGYELQTLPEGKRTKVIFKGYPETILSVGNVDTGIPPDIIISPNEEEFEIIRVQTYQHNLINHCKFMAERIKEGT